MDSEGATNWQVSSGKIYYYVHLDFHERLRQCTPSVVDNSELTSLHSNQIISDAAEQWNVELDTSALVFGGVYSDSTPCSAFAKPAVKIEFIAGCLNIDGDNSNCDSDKPTARFSFDDDYGDLGSLKCFDSQITRIQIYGRQGSSVDTECIDSSTGFVRTDNYTWNLSDSGPSDTLNNPNLVVAVTHELGHALGISHPPLLPGYSSPIGCPYTNVADDNKALVSCGVSTFQRHINGYDQTCGYNNSTGVRNSQYHWQGFDSGGSVVSGVQTSIAVDTNKGLRSGGYLLDSQQLTERYGLYSYNELNHSFVGVDGYFSFTSSPPYLLSSTVSSLVVSPNVFTFSEGTSPSYRNRIGFVDGYYSDEIPRHKYARNVLVSDIIGSFSVCADSSCSSSTAVRSHLPMSTAWDGYSNNTIYAWVQTDRNSGQGLINLSAGLRPGSPNLLNKFKTNPINGWFGVTYPSDVYTSWDYSGKTDFPVGVACEPDRDQRDYNCILAWQDRGIPDGSVLYTYFRVNSSDEIEFRPGGPVKRGASNSSSGVSAAYFGSKFWLAWKVPRAVGIKYTSTLCGTGYTCWSNLFTATTSDEVVDPPSWFYVPDQTHESGLIWTEAN